MPACRLPALLLIACWVLPAQSAFDPTDVVQVQTSLSLSHDNNLYRLPDADPALFGINRDNKADTVRILGIGLKLDKLLSRQRVIADVNLNESTYDKNTNLDFVGGNGRLAWLWQLGNYWSGEASYRTQRVLGGFADFRQSTQNLIDTDTLTLTAGYLLHPRWRIAAELVDQQTTNSAPVRRILDFDAKTAGASLTYRTPADNSIGLQLRRTEGNYPNRQTVGVLLFDNGYTETRLNALAAWRLSGALRLDGQIGQAERRHDQLPVRDFSGLTWRAAATWDPSGKTRLTINGTRDVRTFEDTAASYIVVTGFGVSPLYAITPKLTLQADLTHETREYRGDPGFLLLAAAAREDKLRLSRVTLSYAPLRNLDLSLSYENGARKSTNALNNFDYQSWLGTLRLSF